MPQGKLRPAGDNPVAAAVREAIGASPSEEVNIITPQFDRPPGWPEPGKPPQQREHWDALRGMSESALLDMGLGKWGSCDGRKGELYLLPAEWYEHIPADFPITNIFGVDELFQPGVTDDDTRYGLLAFGVFLGGTNGT